VNRGRAGRADRVTDRPGQPFGIQEIPL